MGGFLELFCYGSTVAYCEGRGAIILDHKVMSQKGISLDMMMWTLCHLKVQEFGIEAITRVGLMLSPLGNKVCLGRRVQTVIWEAGGTRGCSRQAGGCLLLVLFFLLVPWVPAGNYIFHVL